MSCVQEQTVKAVPLFLTISWTMLFVIQTNLHSSNASVSATYYLTVLLFPE